MRRALLVYALTFGSSCSFGAAPANECRTDAECAPGACRDGRCIAFATPLDEPVDPRDPPDAGAASDAGE